MTDSTVRGRFVWHELLTSEPQAAQQFYTGVCGWKLEAWDQDTNYSMFVGPKGPVAGIVKLPEGAMGTGEQPKWLPYVATDDVDATVEKAVSLGGKVLQESGPTPGGGRYAVLADPQGACFGVYGSTNQSPPGADDAVARGEFSWHELSTTDYEAAFDFYSQLFGWDTVTEHDMGDMGMYRIFGVGQTQLGGMFNTTQDMPGEPAWVSYVLVQNARKAADKIAQSGGQVVNGPMEVPGGDWIAVAADPHGTAFAVHAYKSKAKAHAAGKAAASEEVPAREEVTEPQEAPGKKKAARKEAATESAGSTEAAPDAKRAKIKQALRQLTAQAKTARKPAKKSAKKSAKKAGKQALKKTAKKTTKKAAKKPANKSVAKSKSAGKKKAASKKVAKTSKKKAASKVAKRPAKKKAAKKVARKAK